MGGADINTGGQAFGLFANPPQATQPVAAAIRKFAKPALTTGDTLSFRLAVNFRNGSKGFTLRNSSGTSQWNFSAGRVDGTNDGYYIRNGVSGSAFDNGQRFGGYHANSIFNFTFIQRERQLQWTAARSGGINATVSGNLTLDSGTIADLRFFITGTDGGGLPQNNLYFNNLSLTTEPRGDLPLTIGERRTPGVIPSYLLRFTDPNATSVTMRHGGDNFANSYVLTKGGDGVWSIDIRNVLTTPGGQPLQPGWHEFKFRPNSVFEDGANRWLYIDSQGRIASPPAVYLTWQRDPTTTMTVHWHNNTASQNTLRYRVPGATEWNTIVGSIANAPTGERLVQTAEITGLNPGWIYEFQVDGYSETFRFRTMPADLAQPVKFSVAGDADIGPDADAMAAAIAARDPAFVAMVGDHAYEDSRAENFWMWERYLQSYFTNLRAPDGRFIPVVAAVGNHEIYNGWAANHPDFENTADWRLRYGSYFFRYFAFPGAAQPYGVLDFGNYLSLLLLDTEHSSPVLSGTDAQTQWLSARLNERRNVRHLLPMYHVPAYPSVRALADAQPTRIRTHWLPLFENAGVHLVFENHDHAYKRTKPILGGVADAADGIVFAGDGAWGVALRTPEGNRTYLHGAQARHHAFLVTITNTGRTIEAVDKAGVVFDSFTQGMDGIPSTPIVPTVSALSSNSVSFTWAPVTNAVSYRILRNGTQIATSASANFTDSSWSVSSNATYQVVAVNRSGNFTNAATAPSPQLVWNVSNNLPWNGGGEGAPTADPDADGIPNLLEYFHGLDPKGANSASPFELHGLSGGNVLLRYRRNSAATDLPFALESTSSLSTPAWAPVNATETSLTGDWSGWRETAVPAGSEGAKFFRLRVGQ
ncbi:MAG: fibronectin type III domain-containing protein [Verrucomicrobia bacterium]|nr:fibronectin type III domain-containing protein [Verrucomicrobiota bacterium]